MGIGYQDKLTEETTSRWWEDAYNKAALNITSTGASKEENSCDPSAFTKLTDEELFKACGGLTAHKGARHGLRLGGKLERIKHQEEKLLDKRKKRKKTDQRDSCDDDKNDMDIVEQGNKSLDRRRKNKQKRSRRSESDCDNDKNNVISNEPNTTSKKRKNTKKNTSVSADAECLSN